MNLQRTSVAVLEPAAAPHTTMKAIVQDRYGSSEVLHLEDVEKPHIGDNEVLLRVRAVGLHIGDWHYMAGLPYLFRITGVGLRAPKARVRGMDVAGTVDAVGKNVTQFRPGDEVFGIADGAFAEYASASADKLAPKPTNLTFEQAAAVPTSAATALHALRDVGKIRPSQKVLIIGASGNVGNFAVQIAKSFGAEVTGVSSTSKMDIVRSVGADYVIDYAREDFTRSGRRYDLVLDMGGNRSLSDLWRILSPHGTLVIVGGEGGGRWFGGIDRQLRGLLLSPFIGQRIRTLVSLTSRADLLELTDLIEAGKLAPVIDRTYPLSEVPEAMHRMERRQARGKLVIHV